MPIKSPYWKQESYRENPTLNNLWSDSKVGTQEKLLRSVASLAEMFTPLSTSLAGYSPEAKAALLPASVIEAKLGRRALRAGVSHDKLLNRKGIVHDGKEWNRFFKDDIDQERILKALREDDSSQSLLKNFWRHSNDDPRVRAVGTTSFRFDPTIQYQGQFTPSNSRLQSGSIEVSPNYPLSEIKNTIRHEGQHSIDSFLGRSSGTEAMLDSDTYLHNLGEVRARLNASLGSLAEGGTIPGKVLNPKRYEGLQDLFYEGTNLGDPSRFKRRLLWEE